MLRKSEDRRRRRRQRMMVGWNHQLNGHEYEETLGDMKDREAWHACSPWGHKDSDMGEQLNNNNEIKEVKVKYPHSHESAII